jgi:hypothetical protein
VAVSGRCLDRLVEGPDPDRPASTIIPRCRISWRGEARLHLRATPSPRWSGSPASCRAVSATKWTGQSLQEKLSGSQAPFLLALSALVVFLCLAALYESWTIPLAVLLTVPLGICGAVLAATLRGPAQRRLFHRRPDHHHRAGAAKDAILIIEFAKDLRAQGKPLIEATVEACALRFPPDPDDRPRLRLRRAADGDRHRRRRRQPAGARHQRDGRHDRGGVTGAADGAGVLRRVQRVLAGTGSEGDGGGENASRHAPPD